MYSASCHSKYIFYIQERAVHFLLDFIYFSCCIYSIHLCVILSVHMVKHHLYELFDFEHNDLNDLQISVSK